jgi:polyhydroxyalkanoate synthesis regulator phasin
MFETLDKLMLAGLGAVSMTRERAQEIFDEYVAKGEVEKDARSGFVKDLVAASEKTRQDLEKLVDEQVEKAIRRMKLATQEDLAALEGKMVTREDLARIEAKLDAMGGSEG